MHPFIHFVLIIMFFNSFVLFVAACMQTLPAEGVSIASELDNTPLRRIPILNAQDDYSAHIQQFRQAKTFPSPSPTEPSATESAPSTAVENHTESDKTELLKQSNREPLKKNARIFAVTTNTRSENPAKEDEEKEEVSHPEPAVSHRYDNNNVHDDRDLFEALQVEKSDICGSCPPIWMKNTAEMKDMCANHESVAAFFSMTLDKRDAQNVVDTSDLKECTRTITCTEPHMLVKWHESELCDVHAPYTGSLITDVSNTFVYKCNGTQWTLHGFPLSSVVCAVSSN